MIRKLRVFRRGVEPRLEPAPPERWELRAKAALLNVPGMVSEPMSQDYPRIIIRLP